MVVHDRKIYDPVRVFRRDSLVNASVEFDFVRDKSRSEVWIPCLAILPVGRLMRLIQ